MMASDNNAIDAMTPPTPGCCAMNAATKFTIGLCMRYSAKEDSPSKTKVLFPIYRFADPSNRDTIIKAANGNGMMEYVNDPVSQTYYVSQR